MFPFIDHFIRGSASWLWGAPMLIFLSGVGIYFTLQLRGLQFRYFFRSGKLAYQYRTGSGAGNITPLQSLFSALGGVIGNGNIAGVATAIAVGGPGAIFWLWIASFVAMIIVYAETYLSVTHRERSGDGTYSGGPMYYIEKLLHFRWLAVLFALAMGLKALLATATIQSNSIALAARTSFGLPMLASCFLLAVLTWVVTIGGITSIARTLEKLTPIMVILYSTIGLITIFSHLQFLTSTFRLIITRAFTPAGATGGFAGASIMMALRYGVARGFYSNEAGTGSSPIMFSAAKSDDPIKLSFIGMFGVVIDTAVGTLTAIVILITGTWISGQTSTALTTMAYQSSFGNSGGYLVFLASFLFGYSTLVAWCFYGEQCFAFIWGSRMRRAYRWGFCLAILFGFPEAELLWSWGDLLNAFTVLINVAAVVILSKHVVASIRNRSPSSRRQ